MKKLFFALTITLSLVLLFSCSSDKVNETITNSEDSVTNLIKQRESVQDVSFGESVEVTNENKLYVLTEYSTVKTDGNKNYIVTIGNNKKPIYIIEYSNNQMKIDDLINGSIEVIELKNKTDIDLIAKVKEIKENPRNNRGPFWGWQCGLCAPLPPSGIQTCCYYIIWSQLPSTCEERNCIPNSTQL